MNSLSNYNSLLELFPQVDTRILRAVSIEHGEDINEAVEFILSVVLPATSTEPDWSCSIQQTDNSEQELRESTNGPVPLADDGVQGSFLRPILELSNSRIESNHEASVYDNSSHSSINHSPIKENESLFNGDFEHQTKFSDPNKFTNMNLIDVAEVVLDVEDISDEQPSSADFYDVCKNTIEYVSEKEKEVETELNECYELSSNMNSHAVFEEPLVSRDEENCLEYESEKGKVSNFQDFVGEEGYDEAFHFENLKSFSLDGNSPKQTSHESCLHESLATRSGHIVSTDMLEDSIEDAKNSKQSLASSLKAIVSMMREVELVEGKAKQAKEDALASDNQILPMVEELQHIVKQSKELNDMKSGQVYGERSILATEARGLQSRLLKMSEERTKYLFVTEEIFITLDARRAAADDEIVASDVERRENLELAQKALQEQEILRDAIVAESRKLEHEEMENSKLREFLMDRGHIVDALQGEIAIICEDILSLRQRVEDRTPLTKSLMSSFSLAKSISSQASSSGGYSANSDRPINKESSNILLLAENKNSPTDDWELM